MKKRALRQPLGDIWKFYNGHVRTPAHGMKTRAVRQPRGAIWKFSNGHSKTAAREINRRALVQPLETTWKFFNGHATKAVRKNDTGSWEAAARYLGNLQAAGENLPRIVGRAHDVCTRGTYSVLPNEFGTCCTTK